MLDILIPQYRETEEMIKPLLDSIALQQGIHWDAVKVKICNDGSEQKLSKKFLSQFPYDVTYIEKEHSGISATRNRLLDAATEEYVMFCDADDMFFDMFGLNKILGSVPFEVFQSVFIEETPTGLYPHENDDGFVHGKAFSRKYLKDNGIRFCEDLEVHEDIPFVATAMMTARDIVRMRYPFYLWKTNEGSVTRSDENFLAKTYPQVIDANARLVYSLLTRHNEKRAADMFVWMVYVCYYAANRLWDTEYRAPLEERFKKHWHKYRHLYQADSSAMQTAREKAIEEGFTEEHILFSDWLKSFD